MEEPPFRSFFPTVLLLTTLAFLVSDLYTPSLPAIKVALKTSESLVQLTLSFYLVAIGFMQLIYGPLSDRFGRRKVIMSGIIFSLIGSLFCMMAWNIYALIIGRILQGLGLGVCPAVGRAIIRDAYKGERLAQVGSYLPIGTALILGGAPIIGGYIQSSTGWRINFLAILMYTILLIAMALKWLPETNHHKNPLAMKWKTFWLTYFTLVKDPSFIGYSFCSAMAFGSIVVYFVVSPFLFIHVLGFKPESYGWFSLFIDGGVLMGGIFNGMMLRRLGRHHLLRIGAFIMFLGGGVMLVLALFGLLGMWVVMLPMTLCCMGVAITFANSFAGAFHPFEKMAGYAGALFGFIQILGGAVISAIVSVIMIYSQFPLAITLTVIGALTFVMQSVAFKASLKRKHHD